MRGVRFGVAVAAVLLSAAAVCAQDAPKENSVLPKSVTEPLEKGTLVVWFVERATPLEQAQIAQRRDAPKKMLPTTVQESTAGSFGQTASSVGQTAGSYGTSPSQVGRSASSTGKPASEHGTAASNYGTNASNAGQNAGNVGQTAGSFGQTASNVGTTAGNYSNSTNWGSDKRGNQSAQEERWSCAARSEAAELRVGQLVFIGRDVCAAFPQLHLQVEIVPDEDLLDHLKRVAGTTEFPDIIFGTQRLQWWDESGYGLTMLGWPMVWPSMDGTRLTRDFRMQMLGQAVVLRAALHPLEARAFAVWLRDEISMPVPLYTVTDDTKIPVEAATEALASELNGGTLDGLGDEQAAKFDGRWAQMEALMPPPKGLPENLQTRVDVTGAWASRRMALVSMRGIVWSPEAFGVVHALAVLRKDAKGSWKVLQISPNQWPEELTRREGNLRPGKLVGVTVPAEVHAVLPASPIDNDVRSAGTELSWDNDGSAVLEVVEWQSGDEKRWSNPHVFPVRDIEMHAQTRVAPDFTRFGGHYRWRVWSVGADGRMAFTPWRMLTIAQ